MGREFQVPKLFKPLETWQAFTVTELAWLFGISVKTVHYWIEVGKIHGLIRTGKRGNYQIPRREVIRLLKLADQEIPGLWTRTRKKLLVIDDYEPIRKLVTAAFRDPKFALEVKTAATLPDGLMLVATFRPDVMVLDDVGDAPPLTTEQAIGVIRKAELARGVKIIAVSSIVGREEKLRSAGADEFLGKPFSLGELRAAVLRQAGEVPDERMPTSRHLRAVVQDPPPSN